MPRKAKGIHTSPEKAGEQNFESASGGQPKDELNTMEKILPIYSIGDKNREDYGGNWNEPDLRCEVNKYFTYCAEKSLKPCKAGLIVWLGISTSQYYEWATKPDKYGFKSEILDKAHKIMEISYVERMEQFPTGNIFLLKAGHGMVETNKVEISTNGQVNKDEVKETISKLGLDE